MRIPTALVWMFLTTGCTHGESTKAGQTPPLRDDGGQNDATVRDAGTADATTDRCPPGYRHRLDGTCDDIDECAQGSDDCSDLAACVNRPGSYACECRWLSADATCIAPVITAGTDHSCRLGANAVAQCWGRNDRGQAAPPVAALTTMATRSSQNCAVTVEGDVSCWGHIDATHAGAFTSVAVAPSWYCALDSTGAIHCWGGSEHATPPMGTFASIALGNRHGCAVDTQGSIVCWGDNLRGQASPPPGSYTQLVSGADHSCALTPDGRAHCWGSSILGQTAPPELTFAALAAGEHHTCGITTDGAARCWGDNSRGQSQAKPGTFVAIAAGSAHTCAITQANDVMCWGYDSHGQATSPETTYRDFSVGRDRLVCAIPSSGSPECWGDAMLARPTPTLSQPGPYSRLCAGKRHECALRDDGAVDCWRDGTQVTTPVGSFTQLACGEYHTCALTGGRAVKCWGDDWYGQLAVPERTFVQVSAGHYHTCAVDDNGDIACWGLNASGQTDAPGGTFTTTTGGREHSCAVRHDGTAVCWGNNTHNQLDAPPGQFVQLSGAATHTCGLRQDGSALCWGEVTPTVPYAFDGAPVISTPGWYDRLNSGGATTCGIRRDGLVTCWQTRSSLRFAGNVFRDIAPRESWRYGAIAIDGILMYVRWNPTPWRSPAPSIAATRISAGTQHACALDDQGTIHCWGRGAVNPPSGQYVAIASSLDRACAIRSSDGQVSCWGNTTEHVHRGFRQIHIARDHGCGVTTSGAATCWGTGPLANVQPPAGPFAKVVTHHSQACGLRPDGTTACWQGEPIIPSLTPPPTAFIDIAAAHNEMCGLTLEHKVTCWGQWRWNPSFNAPIARLQMGARLWCGLTAAGHLRCVGDIVR